MKTIYHYFAASWCFSILLLFVATTNAQWYNPGKVNKKAYSIYEMAYQNAQDQNYTAAFANINKAILLEPKFVEAYLSKAGIYAELKKYDSSIVNFETAFQLDAMYTQEYLLPYSISMAGTGQFQKALTAVNKFLTLTTLNIQSKKAGNFRKSTYEFALDYNSKHSTKNYVFTPKNLGDSVNSTALEYYPSLTIDGKKLIFTRRTKGDEDFYECDWIDGKWSQAKPLPGKVNTNLNEGAQNISLDGEWIIFAGCNYPEGSGSCDLYISFKTKNGWGEAENLGAIVNTDFWESAPSLSPDKRDLYFSSNQPGSRGGKDIWVTHRSPQGKWSRAKNLGATINTGGDESCPFMYADNQTLFFNSNGHPGYGQADLFYTKKLTDTSWSVPENLGYPINTIDEEGSLIVAADGKTAYYASDGKDTRGGLDLYSFQLREDLQPPKTLWVKGKVYDVNTRAGLPSSVELTDISTRRLVSKVQTDEEGNYLTTLPVGKAYAFNVNRKGYLFFSENYNITAGSDSSYTADIPLQPITAGASIVLKNIFFDTKQTKIKPASLVELDKVIELLNENPALKIIINGYTDNVGKPADNIILSNGRSLSVVNYLLSSQQIAANRLQFKGLGEAKPIAPNTTEAGRALNRRTELKVISN